MSLGKAIKFVKEASTSSKFRATCVEFEAKEDLLVSFDFSELDFDDAINMQLVKCQSYEQAEAFQQLRMWFSML